MRRPWPIARAVAPKTNKQNIKIIKVCRFVYLVALFARIYIYIYTYIYEEGNYLFVGQYIYGDRGGTVVKVLRYKSEGGWFDSRWCHLNFSLT